MRTTHMHYVRTCRKAVPCDLLPLQVGYLLYRLAPVSGSTIRIQGSLRGLYMASNLTPSIHL